MTLEHVSHSAAKSERTTMPIQSTCSPSSVPGIWNSSGDGKVVFLTFFLSVVLRCEQVQTRQFLIRPDEACSRRRIRPLGKHVTRGLVLTFKN